MNQELQFGQMVTVCGKALRSKYYKEDDYRVQWIPNKALRETVMVIGKRTVFNGIIRWDGSEYGYHFEQTKPVDVYLVVRNMRTNPFYVFPEQIIIEAQTE